MFNLLVTQSLRNRLFVLAAALLLIGYGSFRFIAEYFREPDAFLGLLALGMSMGQWLCVPMVAGGVLVLWLSKRASA